MRPDDSEELLAGYVTGPAAATEATAVALARAEGAQAVVLVEGVSRRDESMLNGRTRQGKLIHFAAGTPAGTPAPGALARVEVTAGHPHHLSGRLEEVTARPRHRVRIPVASA